MPRVGRVLLLVAIATGCSGSPADKRLATAGDDVRGTAQQVVVALATHDLARVASFVDPTRGLRFSPYPFVDTTSDRVVTAHDVATLWSRADSTHWGSYDGSGEPILLPYSAYHAKFVYDADFQHAPHVAVDSQPIGRGNATHNLDGGLSRRVSRRVSRAGEGSRDERHGLAKSLAGIRAPTSTLVSRRHRARRVDDLIEHHPCGSVSPVHPSLIVQRRSANSGFVAHGRTPRNPASSAGTSSAMSTSSQYTPPIPSS